MKYKMLVLTTMIILFGCEELLEIKADSMTIEKVTLEMMSFRNESNIDWDELSGPDVYIRFEESDRTGYLETGTIQDISLNDLPINWELNPTFTIEDFDNNLEIFIYDADILSDDLIASGAFEFDPYDDTEIFTLTFDENCELTIEVSYEW
ncbi:MAG: hypothetical protein ABIA75_00880 [Candidatus Neomarinimicrobiota bacterium]